MATRFYFHSATNATAGLPTSEQSSLTATVSVSAQTLNRLMNTTIGTGMTSIGTNTSSTSSRNLYYARFVSQPFFQTSIAANTWTYNFSINEQNAAANFPVTTGPAAVRVNCYVWRPSTSTKIGTILDGNTAATVNEPAAGENRCRQVTFTGAAVAGTAANDVIVFEVWFIITSNTTTSLTKNFFFDGTTVSANNTLVTNHASFIETPENLVLVGVAHFDRAANESFTVTDQPPVRVYKARRTLPSNTVALSANAVRFMDVGRLINATLTISASPVKVYRTFKTIPSQAITIVANVLADKLFARSLSESIIIDAAPNRFAKLARTFPVTLTLAANPVVTRRVLRTVNETFSINAIGSKVKRFVRTAANSLTIADSVIRDLTARRTIAEPITIVASITKVGRIRKTVSNSITVTANAARTKRILMTVNNSITIAASPVTKRLTRMSVSETLTVNGTAVRRLRAIRPIAVPITIAAAVNAHVLTLFVRTVNESLTIGANVARIRRVPRLIVETISVATQAIEKLCSAYD